MTTQGQQVIQPATLWNKVRPWLSGTVSWLVIINALVAGTAFIKDVLQASYLGTTSAADALTLAYFIPDSIGQNVIAASVGVACVPVFSRLQFSGRAGAFRDALRKAALSFVLLSVAVTAVLYEMRGWLIHRMTGGHATPLYHMTLLSFEVILPMMLLVPFAALGSGALQSLRHFNVAAVGPLIINVLYLGTVAWVYVTGVSQTRGIYVIAAGIVTSILCMTLWNWGHLLRRMPKGSGPSPLGHTDADGGAGTGQQADAHAPSVTAKAHAGTEANLRSSKANVIQIWKTFVPYLLILLCSQLVFFVERGLAAQFQPGTIAGLNYAYRLTQFPIWVYVAAISVVVLPAMSRYAAAGDNEQLLHVTVKALRNIIAVTVPVMVLFCTIRVPLVSVLFQRGAFQASSVDVTESILAGYSLTIVGQAVMAIGLRFYLAQSRPGVPLAVFAISSAVNIGADVILTHWMGPAGLGYGAAVGAFVGTVIILKLLSYRAGVQFKQDFVNLRRILPANLAALGVALLSLQAWPRVIDQGEIMKMAYLGTVLSAFAGVYWLVFRVFQRKY